MKSIEVASDLLMQQMSFAKYFLKTIGIQVNDKNEINIKHEELIGRVKDYFEDSFYYSFNELEGLKLMNASEKVGMNILNEILFVMIELLNKKVVINDSLLVLCLQYFNYVGSKVSTIERDDFICAIINCVKDCLSNKKELNERSYHYFKHFLLFRFVFFSLIRFSKFLALSLRKLVWLLLLLFLF